MSLSKKPKKAAKKAASSASVVKRTLSIPTPLYTFASAKAKSQAKALGQPKPNVSGYVSGLIAADKARSEISKA